MSPHHAPARMHLTPVFTGRMTWSADVIVASITTTIITGTGTIGSGRVFVRR
jgi:hypothetical protein